MSTILVNTKTNKSRMKLIIFYLFKIYSAQGQEDIKLKLQKRLFYERFN